MRQVLNRIGGPYGISFSAWLLISPISILFTQDVVPEGIQLSEVPFAGYLVGIIGHLATGLVLFAGKLLLLRNVDNKPRPLTTLAVMALAGITRGFSVAYSFEWFGLVAQADYFERMRSGAVLTVIWFAIAGLVIDSRSNYLKSYSSLATSLDEQLELRLKGEKLIEDSRSEILDQIRATLRAALRLGTKSKDIHVAVDDLIRPLSHRLAADASGLRSQISPPSRRLRAKSVLRTALGTSAHNPLPTAAMAIFGTITSKIWSQGPIAILASIFEFALIWGLLALARRIRLRGVMAPVAWVATGLVSVGLTEIIFYENPFSNPLLIAYLAVNVLVPAALFAFLGAYQAEAELNLSQLRKNLSVLGWETKALEQRLWVERQRLGRFVHSELQSRLRAFALRFDFQAQDPTQEDLERLREDCERSLVFDDEIQSLDSVLQMQLQLWEGIMEVSFEPNSRELQLVEKDAYAASCASMIIREGLANAVKHGKAKRASVSFQIEPLNHQLALIEVKITNDGLEPKTGETGLGMKTLSELTSNLELIREDGHTILRANLPMRVASENIPF